MNLQNMFLSGTVGLAGLALAVGLSRIDEKLLPEPEPRYVVSDSTMQNLRLVEQSNGLYRLAFHDTDKFALYSNVEY